VLRRRSKQSYLPKAAANASYGVSDHDYDHGQELLRMYSERMYGGTSS
jgi:hypothetical protein